MKLKREAVKKRDSTSQIIDNSFNQTLGVVSQVSYQPAICQNLIIQEKTSTISYHADTHKISLLYHVFSQTDTQTASEGTRYSANSSSNQLPSQIHQPNNHTTDQQSISLSVSQRISQSRKTAITE
jgi:hypothetical protein